VRADGRARNHRLGSLPWAGRRHCTCACVAVDIRQRYNNVRPQTKHNIRERSTMSAVQDEIVECHQFTDANRDMQARACVRAPGMVVVR